MRIFGCKDCEYCLSIKDKYCGICKTTKIPFKEINTPEASIRVAPKNRSSFATPKAQVSPVIRKFIFTKYPICLACGSDKNLTLDHVVPRSLGGSNDYQNLQTLCFPCNAEKGSRIRDYRMVSKYLSK